MCSDWRCPASTAEHQAGVEAVRTTGPDEEGEEGREGAGCVCQEEEEEAALACEGASEKNTGHTRLVSQQKCILLIQVYLYIYLVPFIRL